MNAPRELVIVLNLLPLKSGGGVQVALDLLLQLARNQTINRWYIVARQGTPFSERQFLAGSSGHVLVPDRLSSRLAFELVRGSQFVRSIRADVVFTLFGPSWFGVQVPQVVGCAYSNILYPEVHFWARLSKTRRLIRRVIDLYRAYRVKRATLALFETEGLAARAVSVLGMPSSRVRCLRPGISRLVRRDAVDAETAARFKSLPGSYRVLLLASYHPNKNLEIIPDVLRCLERDHATRDIVFVTTMQTCPGARRILDRAQEMSVGDRLVNVGPLPQAGCVEGYRHCDAVLLASQLESFSNNITEAWEMQRPLIVPDLDWARSICGAGALYVPYNDAAALAAATLRLRSHPDLVRQIVEGGRVRLSQYPSSEARFAEIETILSSVVSSSAAN